jgi:hypothetical protein
MIVAYDANGREMHIARSDWRNNVFLPGLEQKWNNAAELYDAILGGLNDGFAADLIPAAARLVEIDDDPERSHTIQSIVLMENKRLVEAENTLQAGIAKVGATGILLTNLAKFSLTRVTMPVPRSCSGRLSKPIQIWITACSGGRVLSRSVKGKRDMSRDYVPSRRCPAPGAQLWLARYHLEHNNVAAARALYDEVLASGRYDGSSLMMISGDLGRNGEIPAC